METLPRLGATIELLAAQLRGALIRPDEADYDAARAVWNGRFEKRPALIVRAADAGDVETAVRFAREADLPLSVRGAGHHANAAGVCDAGITIDLSGMKGLEIDLASNTARAEPGLTTGEFLLAIHAQGRIVTVGSHSSVGLTGLTLGGGIGILNGKYGLTCDSLLSVEIVTADGILRTASATENADLFWAVRGGGGNFGVVTSLTYRLHPLEPMIAGMVFHPLPRLREMLRFYREFVQSVPNELTVFAAILTGPQGMAVAGMMACYTGPLDEGERLVAPLKAFGPPVMDILQPMPYPGLLAALDAHDPPGAHYAFSCRGLPELTDAAIDEIVAAAETITSPGTAIVVYHLHGATCRIPVSATAFAARETPHLLGIYTGWDGGDAAPHLAWLDAFRTAMEPHTNGSCCLSLTADDSAEAISEAYGSNFARLQQIKDEWDPENRFRHCYNVPPTAHDGSVGTNG